MKTRQPAPDMFGYMPTINDVPCPPCVRGYNHPHECDSPRYCACDQSNLHTNDQSTEEKDSPENSPGPASLYDDTELRVIALTKAVEAARGMVPGDVVPIAEQFHAFLTGQEKERG